MIISAEQVNNASPHQSDNCANGLIEDAVSIKPTKSVDASSTQSSVALRVAELRDLASLQHIEQTLADETTYSEMPPDELNTLLSRAGKLRQVVESIEEQWMEAVEQLETQPNGD